MTPFELSLKRELDAELLRFANEWLFKWHNTNIEGREVDVDGFDGRRIRVGGIAFEGNLQGHYWRAIGRYLSIRAYETFKRWDEETRSYPASARLASIDGVERYLRQFVAKIIEKSVETDRRLRGQGYPDKVRPYDPSALHTGANVENLAFG